MDAPRRYVPASDNRRRHAPAILRNRNPILTHSPEQERIVWLLVDRVEIGEDGAEVRLRMDGLAGLVREMQTRPVAERDAA